MDNVTSRVALNATVENENGSQDICTMEDIPVEVIGVYLTFLVIPMISNGILLTAIGLSRGKLRHSIVYLYAASCLLSVICFCLVATYDVLHIMCHFDDGIVDGGVLQRFNQDDSSHVQVMRGYSFRRGLMVAMLLVMELNVGSMVYAVGDNAYFVSRTITNQKKSRKDSMPSTKNLGFLTTAERHKTLGKRGQAALQLSLSWMIPILLCIPTAVDWNCLNYCACLPTYRSIHDECSPPESSNVVCSRLWFPTTRSFIVTSSVFYLITVVFMLTMLGRVVRRFVKVHSPAADAHVGVVRDSNTPKPEQEENTSYKQDVNGEISRCDDNGANTDGTSTIESSRNTIESRSSRRPKLHDNVKLLIALTISVTVSVTPMILTWFADVVRPTSPPPKEVLFDVTIAVTLFHALCVPWILLCYMAGLRKACKDAFVKCPCFTTIAIKRRKANAVATSVCATIGAASKAQVGDFKSDSIIQSGARTRDLE